MNKFTIPERITQHRLLQPHFENVVISDLYLEQITDNVLPEFLGFIPRVEVASVVRELVRAKAQIRIKEHESYKLGPDFANSVMRYRDEPIKDALSWFEGASGVLDALAPLKPLTHRQMAPDVWEDSEDAVADEQIVWADWVAYQASVIASTTV